MSLFNLNTKELILHFLPIVWRKEPLVKELESYLWPLKQLHGKFLLFRSDVAYRMSITPQVFSLERMLNDKYDTEQRRIYISNPIPVAIDFIYKKIENKPVYLYRKTDKKPNVLHRAQTYNEVNGDFVVNIPLELQGLNELELKALLDYYKLYSKTYSIKYYE